MQRQIKFRFWDLKNNTWVKQMGLYDDGLIGDFSECFHNIAGKNGEYFVAQQFTGLQDKNGRDIYEGDILAFKEGDYLRGQDGLDDRLEVFWDIENSKFGIKFFSKYGGEGYTGKSEYLSSYAKKTQIIGNIFENPELLSAV
jgi:uncharacterized phage protein (TIGR01671 family)